MKTRKNIIRVLIVILVMMLSMGTIPSLAMQDYPGDSAKTLRLSYFRYANGRYTDGYALNTTGNEGESHHPIYQIMDNSNKTNYYCLNATAGESWLSGTIGTTATYNRSYDLNSASDIELLKNDSSLPAVYKNVVNSSHLKQILWILDNIYIPDSNATAEQNLAQKQALLAKAGILYGEVDGEDLDGNKFIGYHYVPQTGYDYSAKTEYQNNSMGAGYNYVDNNNVHQSVELPDELVEIAQQAALWYFTNYLENNSASSQTYNVKDQWLPLVCSNGTTQTDSTKWLSLENEIFNMPTYVADYYAQVGAFKQEQAAILCSYLIDAANNYAASSESEAVTGSPLAITPATTNIESKTIGGTNYYVVGPMRIEAKRTTVYNLSDTITVNGSTSTGAYISDANGTRANQKISDYIGREQFYVTVPKSSITGNNIKVEFNGTYKSNGKTLWISTTNTEQPIVQVTPGNEDFKLTVNAGINKQFDLALRKAIVGLKDKDGNVKLVTNEEGKLATRNISYVAGNIAEEGTATYKHRKDPVVVKKGDIVTYSITIYNEGDMDGYAETIVDKLPEGLKIKGAATGTYTSGSISYSYQYDEATNTITFTNVSKNVIKAYEGGETLSSEKIEIECEVTEAPSTTNNTYLTNIAYISKEYNTETREEVTTDRDSSTTNSPSADQKTTGTRYPGYHGGDNHNGNNDKDVYNDGTNNDDYFPGKEDDDDFEVIVIEPAEFDLALQKYISSIYSKGTTKPGRQGPTINTEKLANGTATTATYTQDKKAIQVKHGDYVTYTFTVYNEGEVDGYVNKITDNIPTGLQFVYLKQPEDGKTLIACDSQGRMEEIEVDAATYQLIKTNNACWSIDANNGSLTTNQYNGENTISITCNVANYLGGTNKLLKAYDSSKDNNHNGAGLDKTSVTAVLRVQAPNGAGVTIRNEAAITEAQDPAGNKQDKDDLKDRDSQINQWPGKDGDKKYQDDEDYDQIILGKVDLALTKFITAVSEDINIEDGEYLTKDTTSKNAGSKENPYTRATKVDTKQLRDNKECHDATYTRAKDPLTVPEKSYVLYNIRVYNEGEVDVYAGEVKDYLPNYLDYVDCEFNTNYGWKVASDGKTVSTDYLSHKNGTKNLLKAFNKQTDDGEGSGLDYRDLQILCRVNSETPDETKLVNTAEITKYEDEEGENLPEDIDSKPENVEDKNQEKREEDDDDWEVVKVKKKKVDLALTKFITAISEDMNIEDGEYLTKDTTSKNAGSKENPYTRATKVDTTKLKSDPTCHDATYTRVKDPITVPEKSYVLYNIRVYNEGEVDVYAGEVKDYLPNYLDYVDCEFNTNYGWKVASDGKTVSTDYLSHKNGTKNLLKAFNKQTDDGAGSGLDYRDLQILCQVNSETPDETKLVNTAEITKYEDEEGKNLPEDVDSKPENVEDKNQEKREEDDDDWEVVKVKKKKVDLALTKFITAISEDMNIEDGEYLTKDTTSKNAGSKENPYTRATKVDTTELRDNPECHDATYTRVKDPITVPEKSYVLYNIRVYNEGEADVYAGEVKDYLPNYLDYVDCEFNTNYGWKVAEDGKTVSTDYLSHKNGTKNLLKAFDKKTDDGAGSGLDYRDLQILCQINSKTPDETKLVNTAEITKYEDEDGKDIPEDIDSKPENVEDKNQEKREEDDDDWEVVKVKKKKVDLALTKFITAVSNDTKIEDGEYLTKDGKIGSKENPYTRATKVDTTELRDNPECHDATYTMVKDPLVVPAESYVLYNIRVYNEGEVDVYAGEVTDHLPDYLDYVDCEFNTNYGWKVASDGKTVSTNYLAYNKEDKEEKNLIKAFDKQTDDGAGSGLDYRDLQVLCKVNDKAPSNTNIVNVAEVTKYQDDKGEDIPEDIDSTPDNVDKKNEDDDDYEVILIKTFDLSLLKYVTTVYVTEDGKTTTTQTGNVGDENDIMPKVEIHRKKVNSTIVKFGYTIKVTNEGDIAGYAKEIKDYVPEGLKFYEEDNPGWKDEGNNVISTRLLENTLLQPGESAEVTVILRWINGSSNLGVKTNTAEISEDYNDEGIPDKDSTPDNKEPKEDDIDDADVVLSISTGLAFNIMKYVGITTVILVVLGTGIILIKKYVL